MRRRAAEGALCARASQYEHCAPNGSRPASRRVRSHAVAAISIHLSMKSFFSVASDRLMSALMPPQCWWPSTTGQSESISTAA